MASKNRPCECGSGIKWKHCCGKQNPKELLARPKSFRVRVLEIPAVGNLKELQEYLADEPTALKNQLFCEDLSVCLGANGYLQLAIELTNKLLKKRQNDSALLLNLAVMLGQVGNVDKQREILDRIPESYLRKNTAYALILRSLNRDEEAVSALEEICRSGNGFYLTFSNLASMYPRGSEQRRYWLEIVVQKFPSSPYLLYLVAADAIATREFEHALSFDLKTLDFSEQPGVIHNSSDRAEMKAHLTALQRMAQLLQAVDVDGLVRLKRGLPMLPTLGICEVNKPIIDLAANAGRPDIAVNLQNELCDTCKEGYNSAAVEIGAYMSTGDLEAAKEAYNRCSPDLPPEWGNLKITYASFLDDRGRTGEAIKFLADNNFFVDAPFAEKLRAAYDGFFYATQLGNHVLANKLITKACEATEEEVVQSYSDQFDGRNTVPSGYFNDMLSWRELNLVYSLVALGRVDDAEARFRSCLGEGIEAQDGIGFIVRDYDLEFENAGRKDSIEAMSELLSWAREHQGDEDYHNQLCSYTKQKLACFSHIAGKLVPSEGVGKFNLADILFGGDGALGNLQHWGAQAAILQSQGDISHIVNSLREQVPGFSVLDERVKRSLVEAEARFLSSDVKYDPSATVHGYCKALEIYLKRTVFDDFKAHIEARKDSESILEQAKSDKKAVQFSALLKLFSIGFIEFGGMLKSIELSGGKTADRVVLLADLRKYFSTRHPTLLGAGPQENLKKIAANYRNPSAHDSALPEEAIEHVRSLTLDSLAELTALRVVTGQS